MAALSPDVPSGRSREDLAARIASLGPWFHNLHLDGIETAPDHFLGDYPRSKFAHLAGALPDMEGLSVLDIGCNAGFYALEMKRRGAARVVAVDHDERYLAQARLAAEVQGADIEFRRLEVYDVGALQERFDVVLFLGVLYHLRHPLLALDLLREHVCRDLLLFQSLQRGSEALPEIPSDAPFEDTALFDEPGYPVLHFVEHAYAGDPTNWWVPNRACSEAMLRAAGFQIVERASGDTLVCKVTDIPVSPVAGPVYPAKGNR